MKIKSVYTYELRMQMAKRTSNATKRLSRRSIAFPLSTYFQIIVLIFSFISTVSPSFSLSLLLIDIYLFVQQHIDWSILFQLNLKSEWNNNFCAQINELAIRWTFSLLFVGWLFALFNLFLFV